MARMKTTKSIDAKIKETEEKFRLLKEKCDKLSAELDNLYHEKDELEKQEILNAVAKSSKSKAEILAFLGSA